MAQRAFGRQACFILVCFLVIGLVFAFRVWKPVGRKARRHMPTARKTGWPHEMKHPFIACTARELERLRKALDSEDAAGKVVQGRIKAADGSLEAPIEFPPEGGQHNQWYQCYKCQCPLETVDAHHHKCPRCGTVYSGYPFDNVLYERQFYRLTSRMETCAWAYAITKDERYADYAAKILRGFAERYLTYEYHTNYSVSYGGKLRSAPPVTLQDRAVDAGSILERSGGRVFEQALNESCWIIQVATAYDLVHDSKALSVEDHRQIREGLILPVCKSIGDHLAGKNNWQSWHNAGMLWAGGILGDEYWVKKAIEDKQNGFLYQMKDSLTSDGMWYENSFGYHFYALSALLELTEGARRLGIDLYKCPELKKAFILPLAYTMSDGTLPKFADSTSCSIRSFRTHYEIGYAAYGDKRMLAALDDRTTWESVLLGRDLSQTASPEPMGSVLMSGAGHAIMRTEGPKQLSAVLCFGPFGGFHGHLDKLSFVLYGLGQEIAVDRGRAASQAYRLPIHKNWYRATISHNTVLVGRRPQEGAEGRCELFAASPSLCVAAAVCDKAYPGVLHRRLLCLDSDYALVFDSLSSQADEEDVFDLLFHIRGEKAECDAASEKAALPKSLGFEYVKNAMSGKTDAPIIVKFPGQKVDTYLRVAPAAGSQVLTGDGRGCALNIRIPLAFVARRGRGAEFASVVEPVAHDEQPATKGVSMQPASEGWLTRVEGDGWEDVYSYDPKCRKRSVEGIATEAALVCLRRKAGGEWTVRLSAGLRGEQPPPPE